MKKVRILFGAMLFAAAVCVGCNTVPTPADEPEENVETVISDGPIDVLFPTPEKEISGLSLTDAQMAYQKAAGRFAMNSMAKLYDGKSFVMSPLSLQMALSLAGSGASGQTAEEILAVLGFDGIGADALNAYSKTLLEQLPALDLGVSLTLANAIVLNKYYRMVDTYKEQMASSYFAPVVNADFDDEKNTLSLINDWSSRNTNGLIPVILEKVNPQAAAYLLNALYFKAGWTYGFSDSMIGKNEDFKAAGNKVVKVDYLQMTEEGLPYLDLGNYQMLSKPMGEKQQFLFTVFLPKEDNGLAAMIKELASLDLSSLGSKAKGEYVQYRIPKFVIESSFELKETLEALGVRRAFTNWAEFDKMISGENVKIDEVIQKATLKLNENGIEGAATTVIGMMATSPGPGYEPPKPIVFHADHPFVYVISERSSGTILFTGVYDGS